MNEVLKYCPFCGGEATLSLEVVKGGQYGDDILTYYVRCQKCWARGSSVSAFKRIGTEERTKAIKKWNTRYEHSTGAIVPCGNARLKNGNTIKG
jgi:Lar family restriction alleviation protein